MGGRVSIQVTVLFFAGAADAAGCRRAQASLPPGATVRHLASALGRRFPRLAAHLPSAAWAVNEQYVRGEHPLREGDEVALIPPVSGGSQASGTAEVASCRIVRDPISADAVLARVMRPEAGGVVLFLGTVRERTGDRLTAALEYEAYESMAEKQLAEVAREAEARWPGCRVAIDHRLGRLEVGEVSVAVAASAPHRPEAFAACRFAIDRLKRVVPVWKREIGPAGEAGWVHLHDCDPGHDPGA